MKKILIACGSPYSFNETMVPFIPELAKKYKIFIMLMDICMPEEVFRILDFWKSKNIIQEYFIIPNNRRMLKHHFFMRSKMKTLSAQNFDIFLSGSMMQVFEKYLLEGVIPSYCIKVCFYQTITYLLEKKDMVRDLLGLDSGGEITDLAAKKMHYLQSLFIKVKNQKSIQEIIEKFIIKLWAPVRLLKNMARDFLDRYVLPLILVGRTFPLKRYDQLTQLGTDQFDHLIFCDEIEAKAHAALYGNLNMHVAQHPARGSCRCHGTYLSNTKILSPLSLFVGRRHIPESYLSLFYRDMNKVLHETGSKQLDIRLHPRETGRWPYQLKEYLCQRGIETVIVGSEKPIREIMCDYLGMAGFASNVLRDARAGCDFAFVVGFEAISKARYSDPRFVYGNSEGIDWIREDGSYDPGIFIRKKHIFPKRKTVVEILSEIADGKEDDNVRILNNL